MTNGRIGVIVVIVNKKRTQQVQKGKIMATVNFAADARAYYLNSEHYETLHAKQIEQSLVMVRSCKVRKRRKTV